ncbi:hypothetical protein MANES_01G007451v8 [Manihot esculenta]|uniref:Uncharacterized protein n=1 Tax=Manihot esculenta TaxID=3983 RepID=A0ACC8E416_MANES|nr:hypothetical protein MANES_01G007451v8 [Manihot esculenta]
MCTVKILYHNNSNLKSKYLMRRNLSSSLTFLLNFSSL